jgi:hypothetical protein
MAVLNGKLYFSWVQHSRPCIPDSTSIPALSNWQLATSQSKTRPLVFLRVLCGKSPLFSVPPCLRGEMGGQHAR